MFAFSLFFVIIYAEAQFVEQTRVLPIQFHAFSANDVVRINVAFIGVLRQRKVLPQIPILPKPQIRFDCVFQRRHSNEIEPLGG